MQRISQPGPGQEAHRRQATRSAELSLAGLSLQGRGAIALLVLVLGSALTSCRSSSPDKRTLQYLNTQGFGHKYSGNAEEENYLTLGDRVQYVDRYNPEVAGVEQVDIDGTIVLPEVGAIPVAGLTRTEVEALLTQRFSPYFQRNDIRVTLATSPQKVFYLVGEVSSPGRRAFTGDLTIFDVIMLYRPKESSANLGRVRLIRADPRDPLIIICNINEMMRGGDSTFNVQVRERDIIVVPATMLAQVGYFISDLITPFTTVFQEVFSSLFQLQNFGNVNRFGNRNNNNQFNVF